MFKPLNTSDHTTVQKDVVVWTSWLGENYTVYSLPKALRKRFILSGRVDLVPSRVLVLTTAIHVLER